ACLEALAGLENAFRFQDASSPPGAAVVKELAGDLQSLQPVPGFSFRPFQALEPLIVVLCAVARRLPPGDGHGEVLRGALREFAGTPQERLGDVLPVGSEEEVMGADQVLEVPLAQLFQPPGEHGETLAEALEAGRALTEPRARCEQKSRKF